MAREPGPSSRNKAVVDADSVKVGDLVPRFDFRAETMSPEDKAGAWREAVGTLFDVDELGHGEPGPFRADLTSFALGPVLLGTTRASGQRFRRTVDTIARSNVDHIIMQLYVRGGYEGVAGQRPMRVQPGDICLFDLAQTYTYCAVKAYDYETGLLKTLAGRRFTERIISNWSVGEFVG